RRPLWLRQIHADEGRYRAVAGHGWHGPRERQGRRWAAEHRGDGVSESDTVAVEDHAGEPHAALGNPGAGLFAAEGPTGGLWGKGHAALGNRGAALFATEARTGGL